MLEEKVQKGIIESVGFFVAVQKKMLGIFHLNKIREDACIQTELLMVNCI